MNNFLHNSILYVNLEQVRQNVRTLLEELEGKALIPVLKGNAYGLGLEELGRTLAGFEEIRTMAVAQVSEGVRLRRAGISEDILVLGGVPEGLLEAGAELDLTLTVWRLGVLPRLAELGRRLGQGGDRPAPGGPHAGGGAVRPAGGVALRRPLGGDHRGLQPLCRFR